MATSAGAFEDDDDQEIVNGCLKGDAEALARLREKHHSSLFHIMMSRGVSATEAEDLLADLWADSVPGSGDKPSLLEKFGGKSRLLGWLSVVVIRRWIDHKRRQTRHTSPAGPDENGDWQESETAAARPPAEDALVEILRRSLQNAFARCPAETLVLLRLRYLHDVTQRELVRMLGWHESKISRLLSSSMEDIQAATLAEIRRTDPWLQLTWDDLVGLCDLLGGDFPC